ncbi:adenosylcobinamide-phosphate synthase CbiB [Lachnospiraceae bacterium 38-14]|nr:adenosylcobinamide-phosphate synthase CbiB [Roseburia sp. 1XD42-69]MCX4319524.1 adenosylcobinamide-phosphate synthase CbiB [Lachnospiraceae bacterium]
MIRIISITLACMLDLIFGDPQFKYHPVCLIGKLISGTEKLLFLLFPAKKRARILSGAVLVLVVCGVSTFVPWVILHFLYRWKFFAGFAVETFFCYQLLAMKSLKTESMKVYYALKTQGVESARRAVALIVGRDTEVLDEKGIAKAAVETVAENASDGVIAPLFYMMLFGGAGGFFYKAVNTMDSMVGYKNERYEDFGRAAAKTDDVLNFLPARICGIFLAVSAFLLGYDGKGAFRIFFRDRKNHASPNSAQGEAAVAGALQVQLGGDAWYFGKLYHKLTIGDNKRDIEPEDIVRANRILYGCGILGWALFAGAYGIFWYILQMFTR